jgi:hypothetical protein
MILNVNELIHLKATRTRELRTPRGTSRVHECVRWSLEGDQGNQGHEAGDQPERGHEPRFLVGGSLVDVSHPNPALEVTPVFFAAEIFEDPIAEHDMQGKGHHRDDPGQRDDLVLHQKGTGNHTGSDDPEVQRDQQPTPEAFLPGLRVPVAGEPGELPAQVQGGDEGRHQEHHGHYLLVQIQSSPLCRHGIERPRFVSRFR